MAVVMAALALLTTSATGEAQNVLSKLVGPDAAAQAPPLVGRALETFLAVERAYQEGRYQAALERLEALWQDAPPASPAWDEAGRAGRALGKSPGLNIGWPPCYYALRMLTDCARWRVASGSAVTQASAPHRAVLSVVTVGRSIGKEPRSLAEAEADGGVEVEHTLAPELLADDHRVVHQSLWLFREWVLASTAGKLAVDARMIHLPDVSVKVQCRVREHPYAGLAEGAAGVIARSITAEVRNSTDWWWFIYPSHVPEQHPDFARSEFITGGMGVGPDGASPMFIIDDRWLTRKPPHIGLGPYTEVERRAYLPQWLQHEFMHHLFRIYPEFGLEAQSHQWFDRKTWPVDFEGRIEPDYYAEAMHKRLQTPEAQPPLHVALRYAPPAARLFEQVPLESLVGRYAHSPVQNDWHRGTITVMEEDQNGQPSVLLWRNQAGVSWRLFADAGPGLLRTGEENPYYHSNPDSGRTFRIVLKRDGDGEYLPEAIGFQFQGGFYALDRR